RNSARQRHCRPSERYQNIPASLPTRSPSHPRKPAPKAGFSTFESGCGRETDSPLEEAVSSEPVSEAKFPAGWENTGNFVRRGLRVRLLARNPASNSMVCEPIPYASEQGIYFGLAGN